VLRVDGTPLHPGDAFFTRRGSVQDIPRSINLTALHEHNRPVYIQYTSAFHPNGQSKFDVVSDPLTTGVADYELSTIWDEFMLRTWIYVKSQFFYGRRDNIYRVDLSGTLDDRNSVATDCTCKDQKKNRLIDCKHMLLINVTAGARPPRRIKTSIENINGRDNPEAVPAENKRRDNYETSSALSRLSVRY
jgi:hypothetical protein